MTPGSEPSQCQCEVSRARSTTRGSVEGEAIDRMGGGRFARDLLDQPGEDIARPDLDKRRRPIAHHSLNQVRETDRAGKLPGKQAADRGRIVGIRFGRGVRVNRQAWSHHVDGVESFAETRLGIGDLGTMKRC